MQEVLLSLVLAVIFAQGFKFIFHSCRHRKFHWQSLVETGGMPSSHASVVAALVLSVYFVEGYSTAFWISLVLALIVMRDAVGVRLTAEKVSETVNTIIKKSKLKIMPVQYAPGHHPSEVAVGVILGIISAILGFL